MHNSSKNTISDNEEETVQEMEMTTFLIVHTSIDNWLMITLIARFLREKKMLNEDRKDTDQWKDDICNRLYKRYYNTLFLRFLSLREECVRVKRTGRRTPVNEKTTFEIVFLMGTALPCFWDSWAWEMSGWGWRGQEGGHRSRRWSGFPTKEKKTLNKKTKGLKRNGIYRELN